MDDALDANNSRMVHNDGILKVKDDGRGPFIRRAKVDELVYGREEDGALHVDVLHVLLCAVDDHRFEHDVTLHVVAGIVGMHDRRKDDADTDGNRHVVEHRHDCHQNDCHAVGDASVTEDHERLPLERRQDHHEEDASQRCDRDQVDQRTKRHDEQQHENAADRRGNSAAASVEQIDRGLAHHGIASHGPRQSAQQISKPLREQLLIRFGHLRHRVGDLVACLQREDRFQRSNDRNRERVLDDRHQGVGLHWNGWEFEGWDGSTDRGCLINRPSSGPDHQAEQRVLQDGSSEQCNQG
mmetsp:Transcript_20543/g.58389  ORF Transcript_20543/g.58389 Transcript_20543/m.58389 type:complete len:297 (+) Transcript_20543:355-1245(+)